MEQLNLSVPCPLPTHMKTQAADGLKLAAAGDKGTPAELVDG